MYSLGKYTLRLRVASFLVLSTLLVVVKLAWGRCTVSRQRRETQLDGFLIPTNQDLEMDGSSSREDDLRGDLNNPGTIGYISRCCSLHVGFTRSLTNLIGYLELTDPASPSLQIGLEVWGTIILRRLMFGVWVEGSRVSGGI